MIAIIDYGMGNLHSVRSAVERLGYQALITSDERELLEAEGAILPGVGAFGDAMEHLRASRLGEA
ncbi:imidazole glycerol phosphate synthase subunit HisH, partial [Paenibacillus validus]|nr:imidazole glycerol phosphate synthase subunit HisH [Paenibacillus validus]